MPCAHCRREILTDGAIASDGRPVHRRCEPVPGSQRRAFDSDAEVAAVLAKLKGIAAASTSTTTTAPSRLRLVAAPALRARAVGRDHHHDHQAGAIAAALAGKLGKIATGSRMQAWARDLDALADEIEGHAARDDVATLRRLANHFATVGPRLVRTA